MLGITIRFDMAQPLSKHTLHVLDVYPNSPASDASLDAYNDYILGAYARPRRALAPPDP